MAVLAVCLLASAQTATAADAAPPEIWFSLGGQGQPPESSESWDILFCQPEAPWPEFEDVKTAGP